jgi:Zn-dependent peptidase ImmA (M78 family)
VSNQLSLETDWEHSESGSPEERATYAAIGIRCGNLWLTEAEDYFVNRVRQKVYLSAYPLAEWFAWNWWRLRWEPQRHSRDWAMAHHMSAIGGGYVWPDITIISDGERSVFVPKPTRSRPAEPLRYLCQIPVIVGSSVFEGAIDEFVERVLEQLKAESISTSNLSDIWRDLLEERSSPKIAMRRKFEALLGNEVDEASEDLLERLVRDSSKLGEGGVQELAAARVEGASPATSAQIIEMAERSGFALNPRDAARLRQPLPMSLPSAVPAWRRGVAAAKALREQERLGDEKISNHRLCQLAGVPDAAISENNRSGGLLSFAFDEGPSKGRLETGRRFDLARLLGDRIVASNGALRPATRTYTYRQKLQRAFAGEFLCPFEKLTEVLGGDFSDDAIQDAARDFNVSVLTVRTLLVNHGLIERETLTEDFDVSLYTPRAA